jgi:alpha-acetolactate decarboxylase
MIALDGRFYLVRARSVPRQSPPYRSLTEVVAEQHVFELHVELPPGVELADPGLASATHDAVEQVERPR